MPNDKKGEKGSGRKSKTPGGAESDGSAASGGGAASGGEAASDGTGRHPHAHRLARPSAEFMEKVKKGATLTERLETYISQMLIDWENNQMRDYVREEMFKLAAPRDNSALRMLGLASTRMQVTDEHFFAPAAEEKKLYPWVVPVAAAAWFEAIFESSAMAWLQAGKPEGDGELVPYVRRYIKGQVWVFGAMIGADR